MVTDRDPYEEIDESVFPPDVEVSPARSVGDNTYQINNGFILNNVGASSGGLSRSPRALGAIPRPEKEKNTNIDR